MKISCTLLVIISMATVAFAAVAIYPPQEKPAEFADEPGCYIGDLKRVLPFDKPYYPRDNKSCLQYTCHRNGETQLFSCGATDFSQLPDNCHVVENLTLDYPKCCKIAVCDDPPKKPTCT